jgi:hypothetical protein
VTTTFTTRNGDTLHSRKTTQPCAQVKAIQALKLPPPPGKITRRTFAENAICRAILEINAL